MWVTLPGFPGSHALILSWVGGCWLQGLAQGVTSAPVSCSLEECFLVSMCLDLKRTMALPCTGTGLQVITFRTNTLDAFPRQQNLPLDPAVPNSFQLSLVANRLRTYTSMNGTGAGFAEVPACLLPACCLKEQY